MEKISSYLKKIYGFDSLSCILLLCCLIMDLAGVLIKGQACTVLSIISYVPLLICLFRVFSTNELKRLEENDILLDLLEPLFQKKEAKPGELTKEEKKIFKLFYCPSCKQKIRVPRHKGKIEISCPQCGEKFIRKT